MTANKTGHDRTATQMQNLESHKRAYYMGYITTVQGPRQLTLVIFSFFPGTHLPWVRVRAKFCETPAARFDVLRPKQARLVS